MIKGYLPLSAVCPCCGLKYKLVTKFDDKQVIHYYYADNERAQRDYMNNKSAFEAFHESLYFYSKINRSGEDTSIRCGKCKQSISLVGDSGSKVPMSAMFG